MQKKTGVHFYINIVNFDDVAEKEEAATQEVKHSIHELDTFFSSVEAYGLKHYPGLFTEESGSIQNWSKESINISTANVKMVAICSV